MATYELVIDNAKMQIHCNDTAPPSSPDEWIVQRISAPPSDTDNDSYGMVEGQLCLLDSGIAVVCVISEDSYAVHIWAINTNGATPVVGPEAIFNSEDNDWTTPPLPDDEFLEAIGDLNECLTLGDYTFGFTGEAEESYDGNTTGHVASIFEVDPDTLEVSRTQFVKDLWASDNVVEANAGSTRWRHDSTSDMVITAIDSTKLWDVTQSGSDSVNSLGSTWHNISAPVAVGDSVFFFGCPDGTDSDYNLLEYSMTAGGSPTDHGSAAVGDNCYGFFGVSDGENAFWVVGDSSSTTGPIYLAVWDGSSLSITNMGVRGDYTGFTGGWYSNVRDISLTPTGGILITFIDETERNMRWILIEDGGTGYFVDKFGDVADLNEPSYPEGYNYAFFARSEALSGGGMIALWGSHTYQGGGDNYGVYFAFHRSILVT